jgi:hypothetical protein
MKKQEQQHKITSFEKPLDPLVLSDGSLSPVFKSGLRKKDIANLVERAVERTLEEGNVFQAAEALAAMEEFAKNLRKDERYIQYLRDELAKHHGRYQGNSGSKIEICEAGVTYDYSSSGEWRVLDEEIKLLTERKKAVEEKLRKIAPGKMIVDEETGEITEAPLKRSVSTYRITLAR